MELIRRFTRYPCGNTTPFVILIVLLFGIANPLLAQVPAPMMVHHCDTGGFGAVSPDGAAYISSGPYAGDVAMVDNNPDVVFIADRNGLLKHQISIAGFASNATGIAFNPTTQFFAVVDYILDEVFIFDVAGTLQDNFDTAGFGCTNPQGITYISDGTYAGHFAIVDVGTDTAYIVSDTGTLTGSFSTGAVGANTPRGICHIPGTDELAIIDDGLDDIMIVNFSGIVQRQFDVGFISTVNYGIAFEPNSGNFTIASANQAEMFFFDGDGEIVANFSTYLFGASQPTGITYIPTTHQYAIVDADTDSVYFVNTDGSSPTSCNIATFSNNPGGITYIPQSGNLAIVDNSEDEVYIIDQNCALQSQFDIATFGINALTATGIVSIAGGQGATGQFAIADQFRDTVKQIDPALPGRVKSQFSLGGLEFLSVEGIAGIDGSGHFAMVDNGRDDALITDSRGVLRAVFDTTPFSTTPRGIAYDSDTGRIAIVDSLSDQVTIIDLPGLVALPELCACDLNNDGRCNILDYQKFLQAWGSTDCP